ncbi:Crp/Fnr family transcriptional regulator [Pseudomonas sp. nanlin1]|uniref:Crp/Fnr family transcriptional regulator n=1 Tax=Pseudomonas sp. nanlin1 TaxID=3040605 RepID=UPI00388D415A
MSDKDAWRTYLASSEWFLGLSAAFQADLLRLGLSRQLGVGQCLFRRGDPPCGLYAVLKGCIRVGSTTEQGREALLIMIEAPHWFGELSLFDDLPRTHDAFAESDCLLLWIPRAALLDYLQQHPLHWRDIGQLMTRKMRLAFATLEQQGQLPAAARVAQRLLLIAKGYGQVTTERRVIQLAQDQLALMLSLSRQTINQSLKDLQQRGAVHLGYGEIEILDMGALQAAAEAN